MTRELTVRSTVGNYIGGRWTVSRRFARGMAGGSRTAPTYAAIRDIDIAVLCANLVFVVAPLRVAHIKALIDVNR